MIHTITTRGRGVAARLWTVIALLAALCAGHAPPARADTPLYVRVDGSDTECNGWVDAPAAPNETSCAFQTITHALSVVDPGGTIYVAAGTYGELVTVGRVAALRGAKAGVDARARSGAAGETVLTGGIAVNVGGVVVDGFLIQGVSSGGANSGIGIRLSAAASGSQVLNSIVQGNVSGLYLAAAGQAQTLIQHNVFKSNNVPGVSSGTGIYADSAISQILIDGNSFGGHSAKAIHISGASGPSSADVTISNNTLSEEAPIAVANTGNLTIENNAIDRAKSDGVQLTGGNTNVTIVDNQITDGAGSGVLLSRAIGSTDANFQVHIDRNRLTGNQYGIQAAPFSLGSLDANFNRIVGNTALGFRNDSGDPVNAENNWWGCNYGPGVGGSGCEGTPNSISLDIGVDYTPWIVLRLSATPKSILFQQTSALTADLTRNSRDEDTSGADHLRDGAPVAFAGQLGTVAPSSDPIAAGQAHSVFTAGLIAGIGGASATFDQQTVTQPITIAAQHSLYVPMIVR